MSGKDKSVGKSVVGEHYREQARMCRDEPTSTLPDIVVREKETTAILKFLPRVSAAGGRPRVLEVGCGAGYLLMRIIEMFGEQFELFGIDVTPEMIDIARDRRLACDLAVEDALEMRFATGFFDGLVSERVYINLLDEADQLRAFVEAARVLRPGGLAVMIEGFKEGLKNVNRARAEFRLAPIAEPTVNNWFTEERWRKCLGDMFEELPPDELEGLEPWNFLSSHYFMTRFFHDAIRPKDGAVRNTEFARFFAQALPPVGDYAPLRIKYLRRTGESLSGR